MGIRPTHQMRNQKGGVSDADRKDSKRKVTVSKAQQKEELAAKEREKKLKTLLDKVKDAQKKLAGPAKEEAQIEAALRKKDPKAADRFMKGTVDDSIRLVVGEDIFEEIKRKRELHMRILRQVETVAKEVNDYVQTGKQAPPTASLALMLTMMAVLVRNIMLEMKKRDARKS